MYLSEITIENFRCFGGGKNKFSMTLNPGFTALVGENDAGKTAIIDAIRFSLGTRDQEYVRIDEADFHWSSDGRSQAQEMRVCLTFQDLSPSDKGAFAEHLTYTNENPPNDVVLHLNWIAKNKSLPGGRRNFIQSEYRSGTAADGAQFDAEAREMLRATYLMPLRDAERALSSGRRSRLSQILLQTPEIRNVGEEFDPANLGATDSDRLSVLGVGDYAAILLEGRQGIKKASGRLNDEYLAPLSFAGDGLEGHVSVGNTGHADARLRALLEKLELELRDKSAPHRPARRGLGSNNLLFMACELLLLGSDSDGFPLLLIEEPEAHLHPQRQLRLMKFLQDKSAAAPDGSRQIQVIVSTHSPNLASAIKLENLVLVQDYSGYPLTQDKTKLSAGDYRFLERFLDVTKANLFFARGVMIVEGDAENILLPTIARLIGKDFSMYGVSIVNVGNTGLRRFARIFQRNDLTTETPIRVPVACMADMDVMPNCAPEIVGRVKAGDDWPELKNRRWRAQSDFAVSGALDAERQKIKEKADGQDVLTFVADSWTLEFDLARFGLECEVLTAANLAIADDAIHSGKKTREDIITASEQELEDWKNQRYADDELASHIYAKFTKGTKASKAIAAQYLAELLEKQRQSGKLSEAQLREMLPEYVVGAIDYVTDVLPLTDSDDGDELLADEQ